ncbi:AAA+ ATPase of MoxR-like family, a component of a putative secretion system [Halanaeroarchaeum sp. HSR-CO]|nr:AAA+ ATPase of MoxR-like family, a component of a putative secretion system [Halanaeroarchaeum sp. HSR-CO]
MTGVISRGHVHLEDVPGTGKIVAAQMLAEALGVSFSRIQFTPDLLPADVTGSHVYNEKTQEFEFSKGPLFANIVLADEINRAPPKTQAALLESMGEGQVSVDGETYQLPTPFFLIATQNPIEQKGTFELPEAQRDRFSVKTAMGYPGKEGERELLDQRASRRHQDPSTEAVTDAHEIRQLQATAETISVDGPVRDYIIDVAAATRENPHANIGVSPRGVQKMFEAVRGYALIQGRDYVTPQDVKTLAKPLFAHRVVRTTDASVRDIDPESIVSDALDSVSVPGVAKPAQH